MKECEHDYKDIDYEVQHFYSTNTLLVDLVVYCRKCLDVKYIKKKFTL